MLNTLSSRATFYDIVAYFMPGLIAISVVWLWIVLLCGHEAFGGIIDAALEHWVMASIFGVTLSYVAGHCANSCSSWLLEKHIFARSFADASNWYKRLRDCSPERECVVNKIVTAEFGIDTAKLKPFDLLIRLEESFPQAVVSGFSFLCFYGMSRTMALLSWLSAIPIGIFAGMNWGGCCNSKICVGVMTGLLMCVVGVLFINQYIRFVRYYYDFLASALVFPKGK